jgi:hypothetical protein
MNRQYSKFLYPIIDFVQNKAREILALNTDNSDSHLAKIMPININCNDETEGLQIVINKETFDDRTYSGTNSDINSGTNSGINSGIDLVVPKHRFFDVDIENRNDQVFGYLYKICNSSSIAEIPFFNIYYKSIEDFFERCPV